MLLTEKEMSVLKDLQTQEKNCIDKYEKYAGLAKDDELKHIPIKFLINKGRLDFSKIMYESTEKNETNNIK